MEREFDQWRKADQEYSFFGTEIAVKRMRIWLGPPYLRYAMRMCVIYDLGRPRKVEPADITHIESVSEGRTRKITVGDQVENFLRDNGRHRMYDLFKRLSFKRSTLDYACKHNPNIRQDDQGYWYALEKEHHD